MSENWNRACQLIVGLEKGSSEALDFSNMRIAFEVRQALDAQPAITEVLIYNLSTETMNKFKGEGQDIALYAGYEGNLGLIFQGQVFQFRRGRESPTDTYLCIVAQNADVHHNFAVLKGTLAAGRDLEHEKQAIFESFKANGAQCGYLAPAVNEAKAPRGKTYCGATVDYMKEYADNNNQDLAYDSNGAITLINRKQPPAAKAYVLSTANGLTGMPQLTASGLSAECLLNPKIKVGDQIQIKESLVQTQNYDTGYGQQEVDKDFKQAFGADGYYKVVGVSHAGDTRGDIWQTSIVALGVGATQAVTGVAIHGVQNAV
ncbi:phage protein [Acinetobacter guillouiae]|uniref:phage protein n=1 Tax=Acinetobacter guillouiae TaxID=106649 RepID=UPI003340CB34